jgi:hypothetical protein
VTSAGEVSGTLAGRGCYVVSVTDPYGRILGFLNRMSIVYPMKNVSVTIAVMVTDKIRVSAVAILLSMKLKEFQVL